MRKVFDKYEHDDIVLKELSEKKEHEIASNFYADVLLTIPGRFSKEIATLHNDPSCKEGADFIESIEYSMAEEMDENFLYRRVYRFDEAEAARYHFVNSKTHEYLFGYDEKGTQNPPKSYKEITAAMDSFEKLKKYEGKYTGSGKAEKMLAKYKEKLDLFQHEINAGNDSIPYMTIKQMQRSCYGKVKLVFLPDQTMPRKNELVFCDAFVMLLRHDFTRFGVFELYIPHCQDTLHILEAYRHGRMRIIKEKDFDPDYFGASPDSRSVVYDEEKFESVLDNIQAQTEREFFDNADILFSCHGTKRSAVFAYNPAGGRGISDKEALHVLANEENPKDGDIGQDFSEMLKKNRSQYEGHRTYATTASLLEIEDLGPDDNPSLPERIDYQTSEIFFIEMILLRDASTSEIKKDIMRIENKITEGLVTSKTAAASLERINKHMSLALQFDGTAYYIWPTVQRSVELLTEDLGVKSIAEKYKENETILASMINSLSTQESKKIAESQKRYLWLLALTTPLNAIANVYKNVFYSVLKPIFSESVTKFAIAVIDFVPVAISAIVVIAFIRNENKKRK